MIWLLLAVVAHAGNALVFVVDKSLLGGSSRVSDPLRYTFYSAVLAGVAAVLLVFGYVPLTMFIVGWSALAAVFYIVALWFFFTALKKGEPSRVVPIAGSAVPAFTLLLAVIFLGEVLSTRSLLAVFLLIIGGLFLSVQFLKVRGLSVSVVAGAVISGLFFAGYYAVMKYIYENTDVFLAVFAYSRVVQAVVAVVLFLFFVLSRRVLPRREPSGRLRPQSRFALNVPRRRYPAASPAARFGLLIPAVFVANKALAAGAFILLNYAISLGSVTVANALQGTQYVFLLLLAAVISVWWPRLFKEEISQVAVWQKIGGIVLVSLGVALLV
ncbi:MAG: EamA family transporter [bacterium]